MVPEIQRTESSKKFIIVRDSKKRVTREGRRKK